MSEIIDLQARRAPVTYTVHITHNWDDTFGVFVEGVDDDARSREAVNHALARIAESRMTEQHIHAAMLTRIDALMSAENEPETSELSRLADICQLYESLLHERR